MSAIVATTAAIASPMTYAELERLAANIAKSCLFGIKTTDQAMTLMMIANAEGRHPVLAARDYDIIQGRPAKKAEAMARDFLEGGGKIEWHALSDTVADATFSHPQGGSVRISWDMDRAATAGLKEKDTWRKFPRQMLRSRTVSEGVRTIWPSATSGMYVPEEAADIQPFHGATIDHDVSRPEVPSQAGTPFGTQTVGPDTKIGGSRVNDEPALHGAAPVEAWLAPLDEPNGTIWLKNLDVLLANAQSQDEVVQIGGHRSVGNATAAAPPAVRARISEMLATAYGKFVKNADAPEIVGEDKVLAG